MTQPPSRQSSLSRQLLWPAVGLVLIAVMVNAIFAAWLAADRVRRGDLEQQRRVADLLAESTFPLTPAVLERLRGLTGSEFLVRGTEADGASQIETRAGLSREVGLDRERPTESREWETADWLVLRREARGQPGREILVCSSREAIRAAMWSAVAPPLLVGAGTLALLGPLVAWVVRRLVDRLRRIERRCGEIAAGDFGGQLDTGPLETTGRSDEISQLTASVNHMSRQLRSYRDELTRTERARLLAQVAAGFAHQMRNGLAGARLAIQLHATRCPVGPADESLSHALRQLDLTEEEVRTLLSLGRESSAPPVPVDLNGVTLEIERLVLPMCAHRGVQWLRETGTHPPLPGRVERVRGAVLNLVLNALDALEQGGTIRVTAGTRDGHSFVTVRDTGAGPPPEIAQTLFDPFVTSKPEGIGLGLTMAAAVAREHGGRLTWRREGTETVFELTLTGLTTSSVESESS
jgi:signal transduction histidine kinase